MVKKTVKEFVNLALEQQMNENYPVAKKIYTELLSHGILDPNIFNLLALTLKSLGEYDEALKNAHEATKMTENKNAYFLNTKGMIEKDLKLFDEAQNTFQKVLNIDSTNSEYLNNAANVFYEQKKYGPAEFLYKSALTKNKKIVVAYENLSQIYMRVKQYEKVDLLLEQAMQHNTVSDIILYTRISALIREERFPLANLYYEKLKSKYSSSKYTIQAKLKILMGTAEKHDVLKYIDNLPINTLAVSAKIIVAYSLQFCMELVRAEKLLTDILQNQKSELNERQIANSMWTFACILLKQGKIPDAWDDFYYRLEWEDFPSEKRDLDVPRISKSNNLSSDRPMMICREQGVGDEMMYAGLIPELQKYQSNLIIETSDRLVSIFSRSFPECLVREIDYDAETHGRATLHDYESFAYFGDIPQLVQFDNQKVLTTPYLRPDPQLADAWRKKFSEIFPETNLKVGFSWRSSNMNKDRIIHYTQLCEWSDLLLNQSVSLINLQYGDIDEDLTSINDLRQKLYLPQIDLMNDFENIAGIMVNCDIVVSPFNAVLMQAGALGTSTYSYLQRGDTYALGADLGKDIIRYPWLQKNQTWIFDGEDERQTVVKKIIKCFEE